VTIKELVVMNLVSKFTCAVGIVVGIAGPAHAQGAWQPDGSASAQEPPAQPPPSAGAFEHVKFGVGLEAFYQYNWNRP
jgi:hypothetical protein